MSDVNGVPESTFYGCLQDEEKLHNFATLFQNATRQDSVSDSLVTLTNMMALIKAKIA